MSNGIEITRKGSTFKVLPQSRMLRFVGAVSIPAGGSGNYSKSGIKPGRTLCLWSLNGGYGESDPGTVDFTAYNGYVSYSNGRNTSQTLRVYIF